jgi:phosphate-selective porin OprO/OprP
MTLLPILSGHLMAEEFVDYPDLQTIQQQMEMQEQEIQALRARLNAVESNGPNRSLGLGNSSDRSLYTSKLQDEEAKEDETSLEDRVKEIEDAMKKDADAAKKKKEDDAAKPVIKPRGRIHTDMATFDQGPASQLLNTDIQDGVDFRRARIGIEGTILEITNYRIEMDFAGSGRPSYTDVYLGVSDLPYINNVRAGHYKEWFSLEQLTSANYVTFMERSLMDAFSPARNWGISTFDYFEGEWGTWGLGAFRPGTDDFGDDIGDAGEWAVTGRLTATPRYDEPSEGRFLLHVGTAASWRDPDSLSPVLGNGAVRFSSTPEIRMSETGQGSVPPFVDTGNILTDDFQLYGLEAALVYGPLSVQSEIAKSVVNPTGVAGTHEFDGGYVYVSYFLTGENRTYNRKNGYFDRLKVLEPFFCVCTDHGVCKGHGAWELSARWSYIDLNDGEIAGGYLDDSTIGVNWYLNSYMRLMFNWIHADQSLDGLNDVETDIFAMRYDVHF